MRKITVLGASALLVAGLVGAPAAAFAAPIAGAPVAITGGHGQETCPKEGKVDVVGSHDSIEVTAPEGMVITGYCVKAGSDQSDAGVEYVTLDEPATTVVITHPSGKDISHYTVVYAEAPTPEPSVPAEPSPEPSVPTDEPTVPTDEPTEPGVEPTEPGTEPTEGGVVPTDDAAAPGEDGSTVPAGDEPEVLAATGASTVIGFTLIALALVGGGVTLIVLRRKGVLGS